MSASYEESGPETEAKPADKHADKDCLHVANNANGICLSLENYLPYEDKRLINSPRSLEACRMEGILAQELLYKGRENFATPGKSGRIQEMRYKRFEKKRQELLEIARRSRQSLLESALPSKLETNSVSARLERMSSVPSLRQSSVLTPNGRSKELGSSSVIGGSSNREDYDEIVKKAKERELKLLNKMLSVEEQKNLKYSEDERQRQKQEEKSRMREKLHKLMLKKRMEEKLQGELERQHSRKQEERQMRAEAQAKAQADLLGQETEQDKLKAIERARVKTALEHERRRKQKVERVIKQREQDQFQQEIKLKTLRERSLERDRLVDQQKEEQRQHAERCKKEFDTIKERVRANMEAESRRKLEEYLSRQQKKEAQEQQVRVQQQRVARIIRDKAEQKDLKIRHTISESQKLLEQKRLSILSRQQAAEQRLEEKRQKQKEEEELRKEDANIRNEIKRMNAERHQRKDQYKLHKVREQLAFDELRKSAFTSQKDEFKRLRVENQTEAALQRQRIRTALQNMAIWNVWDMGVVKDIIVSPSKLKDVTIEEMVRRRAAKGRKEATSLRLFLESSRSCGDLRKGEGKKAENRSTYTTTLMHNTNVTTSDMKAGSTKNESQSVMDVKKRDEEEEGEYKEDFD